MDSFWNWAWLTVWAIALTQAALNLLQTWENRRFAQGRFRKQPPFEDRGRVALFAPCKGVDIELAHNLRPLFEQDYGNYELTLIVESENDPACETIRHLIDEYPDVDARIVHAGRSTESGQKVHNLRAATAQLADDVAVLAFVDSDARPARHWLRLLVHRLDRDDIGASTGYRWFVPVRPTLANHLLYSINASVAALLGHARHNMVWGGSWAIRRDVFEATGLHQAWYGTLSDDLVATRVLQDSGLRINFEPGCVVASPLDYSRWQFLEFLRRQYVIGRFYAPLWWSLALVFAAISQLVLWGGVAVTLWALWIEPRSAWMPGLATLALWTANQLRAWLREDLGRICLPHLSTRLAAARRFDIWCWPLVGLVNCLGLLSSLVGSTVTWRGIRYQLFPGGRIRLLHRQPLETNRAARLAPPAPHFTQQSGKTQSQRV